MGKIAEAYVELNSQTKGFDEGLAGSEKKLGAWVEKTKSLLAAAVVAGAGMKVGGFLLEAAEAGSNLGETMSKVKEVFGSSTAKINALAESMAHQFGSVKKVTLDAAANIGLVAQGAGLGAAASAEMATKLVRLADDASSFYNVELDVALEKIRSGLVGEAEPLRAFGVLLSETAVKNKLLQQGIKSVAGEFTESQKVMARSQIIIEGLNKASGDHERTLASYANQVRKLKGEYENWKADFGGPIAGGLAMVMSEVRQGNFGVLNPFADGKERQNLADKAAGVEHGVTPGQHIETVREKSDRERLESIQFHQGRLQEKANAKEVREGGGIMGGMGLGTMMLGMAQSQLMAHVALPNIEDKIKKQRDSMQDNRFQHVGGVEDFLRSAQEKISEREDPTQKEQLRELVKIRDGILKMTGIPKEHGMGMKFPAGAREH